MLITVLLGLASWAVTVVVASALISRAERRKEGNAAPDAADFTAHPDAAELLQAFAGVLAEFPPPDATDPRPHLP